MTECYASCQILVDCIVGTTIQQVGERGCEDCSDKTCGSCEKNECASGNGKFYLSSSVTEISSMIAEHCSMIFDKEYKLDRGRPTEIISSDLLSISE